QDVQQSDLDARRQVRQLVDREDPAVRARDDAVVNDLGIRERELPRRRLDRVDVTDQVRDRDVGRRELLVVALGARDPRDRQLVAEPRDQRARALLDRAERIVANLTALDGRDLVVEQLRQAAQDARLRLAPQAQQDEV